MRKNKNKKIFGALALGMLLLSGGAFTFPTNDTNFLAHSENVKLIKNNPNDFLKSNNLELRKNFDYFEEINKEFSEKSERKNFAKMRFQKEWKSSINVQAEMTLLKAIENEDYDPWKKALTDLRGYPKEVGFISEEDFKILIKVHKDRKDL
ncbi:hypothetical protein COV77_01795 [Candidatus Pacearchaeota archaeon CG11_big_fil_rev_8_21_14_0_20_30_13]|nr:MAG: hypothetical protein COV77_01795 [Candidatus Pacearchaeota archaeon CG11_big_fil_rev_8_21_14_0_20_30_13]